MTDQQCTGNGALRTAILILATMTTGLTAGVFVDWANTIMPGLGDVDDRTFIAAYQALYDAINNPLFIGVEFTGAVLLTGVSVALHLRPEQRMVLIWAGAALAFNLAMSVITFGVPLNEELMTGELNSDADFAAARAQFDEAKWTAWNTARALASTIAFGCLAWALVIHRRPGHTTDRRTAGDQARPSHL